MNTSLQRKIFQIILLLAIMFTADNSWSQSIWTNPIDGDAPANFNPFITGDIKDPNITVSGIGRNAVSGNAAANAYNSTGWSTSATINPNMYFTFTLTPNAGSTINFTSFVFSRQRSSTGPVTWSVRSSVDDFTQNIGGTFSPGTSNGAQTINLDGSAYQNISSAITFRIYAWAAGTATGTARISDFTFNGTVTGGSVLAPVATAATAITTAGFTSNWDAVTGATGYRLDVSTNAAFTSILENYEDLAVSGLSQIVTADIMPNTTYYYRVRAEQGAQVSGNSNVITVIIPECGVIAGPTAVSQSFCVSGTVAQLTATGTGLKWYAAATGGIMLAADTALATGNYYVSQTLNNCESARTTVAVTVNVTPAPVAASQSFCASGTVAGLTATGTDLKWYAAATGGLMLAADTALATGNYYVSQTLNNCESARTTVAVTVNITPAPVAASQTFCTSGTVAGLTGTGTDLNWYAAATGGDVLADDATLVTGNYYVSQTLNNCESARTEVSITVNVTPAPVAASQSFCTSGTVAGLMATGTDLNWYAAATGGDVLADDAALATGNYYVSQTLNNCESARTTVAVTVNVTPAPVAVAQTFCTSGTVAGLMATGTDLNWYAAAAGGDVLADDAALATGNYYVSQTLNNCESTRTTVAVTVNITPAPVAVAQTFCTSGTVAGLMATGTDLNWYAAATGGDVLADDAALVTGNYYVSQTLNNCESARTEVSVTVNVTPAPVAVAQTFCTSGTVAGLMATGTDLNWYAAATGGDVLADDAALVTGNYYVSQTLNNCESARTEVTVTVNVTEVPVAEATQSFTEGEMLSDLDIIPSENIVWYQDEALTTILPDTTIMTDGTTYYAVNVENACESESVAITVNETLTTEAFDSKTFRYYPNPVTDVLNISGNGSISSAVIYNSLGQSVLMVNGNENNMKVDMSGLPQGAYFVNVVSGSKLMTVKVIKK